MIKNLFTLSLLTLSACSSQPNQSYNNHTHNDSHNHEQSQVVVDQGQQHDHDKPVLSQKERFNGVLEAHNSVRAKHGLQPLKWSGKLAAYSQQWANHLGASGSCKMVHRPGTPPYGENLFWASPLSWTSGETSVQDVSIKEIVKVWTDEEKWYDYASNSCEPGKQCGHYTQIVWQNTSEVGCAMKVCADKSQSWVCSYNPAGNYAGQRPYSIKTRVVKN